ncbi:MULTISPECIES: hypothetical protein [Bifidobacterium]|uniref:hypothetical protein n=1 Tax=Bifidobacterium TaxID=1678 RepID=UPI0018DCCEF8|nr:MULTISPECIES: hypothetical protein [Bifidobacterium]MBI0146364.1 hypothetical protein [Bifidobacterium polysaccharolyticum]MBI0153185.1 hypothetical protein [Bifidobacterium sp. M0399]
MHLVSRLRRIMAMMVVLLGLLASLGIASAQADAPLLSGGRGSPDPSIAEQNPATLPQQRNRHPTFFTLANTSHHVIKPLTKSKHPVIADGHARQPSISSRQAIPC